MDLVKELDKLEEKYYGEWEEDRDKLAAALKPLHEEADADSETRTAFALRTINRFGGAFIPYLFWKSLTRFVDEPSEERPLIHEIIKSFADSNFEEEEQQKMKSMLVTYFSKEKPFELNKLESLYLVKMHPDVQEYFHRLRDFTERNASSTEMYQEKFALVKHIYPDFKILSQPITQLREGVWWSHFAGACFVFGVRSFELLFPPKNGINDYEMPEEHLTKLKTLNTKLTTQNNSNQSLLLASIQISK